LLEQKYELLFVRDAISNKIVEIYIFNNNKLATGLLNAICGGEQIDTYYNNVSTE